LKAMVTNKQTNKQTNNMHRKCYAKNVRTVSSSAL
jgi:hypothetical protein